MKTLFIPAKSKKFLSKSKILDISKKLPNNLALCYSVQYLDQAKEIKSVLAKNYKITKFIQVLGCSKPVFPKKTKAILIISDGKFHAVSLAYETKLPVYLLYNNSIEKISSKLINDLEKKQRASFVKFLNAKKIGILVSNKPGQENLTRAIQLKKNLKKKSSYFFIADNINPSEFENFPDIESWINTACPRIDFEEGKIVNINDIT